MTKPLILPKSSTWGAPASSWHPVNVDGKRTAVVTCPNRHTCYLDHEILSDGTVRPSLVCPIDGCGFHEHVKLSSW